MRLISRRVFGVAGLAVMWLGMALAGETTESPEAKAAELHRAVRLMDAETAGKLLDASPEVVNRVDEDGYAPLHIASRIVDQEMVDTLLAHGADANTADAQGRTPLHYAAQAKDPGVVKSLLLAEARVNALDNQGRTPMDYASSDAVRSFLKSKGGKRGNEVVSEMDRWIRGNLPASMHFLVERDIFGFPLWRLAFALLIVVLALAINTLIRHWIRQRAARADATETLGKRAFFSLTLDACLLPLRIVVWGGAVRVIGPVLTPPHAAEAVWITETFLSVALAVFLYQFVAVVEHYLLQYAEKTDTKLDDMLIPVIRKALRTLVIIVAGLHLYQSITDQPITTILAGLGLGGLAFALAAQDTLKNLFGFVMIAIDRPFVVGERISFDDHDGVIESVGLRSTRMRRLDGHVVTIPNSKAADSVIWNIGRRPYIRRILNIGVTYDTPPDKIEEALAILNRIFENHEGMDEEFPPRIYFTEFNADNLNIIVIYWYHPPEYWDYMAFSQRVNLQIMREFEAAGIEFAFPTQTLYLAGDPARDLVVKHEGLPGLSPPSGK